MSGCNKH